MTPSRAPISATRQLVGPLAVMLAAVFALLVLVVSELGHQQSKSIIGEREANVSVQLTAGRLRRIMLVMESSTRGYLATGRSEYLLPFSREVQTLARTLKTAQSLATNNAQYKPEIGKLLELVNRKQADMQEMIRLFQAGDRIGAMLVLQSDVGLETMAEISDLVDSIITNEGARFLLAGQTQERSAFISRLVIWLLVSGSLGGAALLMHMGKARDRDREMYLAQLQAERDILDEQVTSRTAETVELALHMERVREDERGRLARELHDELGGLLTAAKLDVLRIRKRMPDNAAGLEVLQHLSQSLDSGIALKRRIIEDLRPSSLGTMSLEATLQAQCREFAQRAEIEVTTEMADISLPADHALVVYRIVQEALTNVAKYAAATKVTVSMACVADRIEVCVLDNGKGFDPQVVESAGGRGLQGMRFRIRACGGELHIRSSPGQGAALLASFPLPTIPDDNVESMPSNLQPVNTTAPSPQGQTGVMGGLVA